LIITSSVFALWQVLRTMYLLHARLRRWHPFLASELYSTIVSKFWCVYCRLDNLALLISTTLA
jgi:hypothetical protein